MALSLPGLDEAALEQWLEESIRNQKNILGRGYQGKVYLYEACQPKLVIKTAMGRGLGKLLQRQMLRKEHRVYARLEGLAGVPRCFGMLAGEFLLLEYIDAEPFRDAEIEDRAAFFDELAQLIVQLHGRGVAHGDMKKKDNLLVAKGGHPCLIDFGVAVTRKPRWAPINHYLYELAARFDRNACAKLRLGRTPKPGSPAENYGYERTVIESLAGRIKSFYLKIRQKFGASHRTRG